LLARTLMFSSTQTPAVSVYPDGDKIGVFPGNETDDLIFRRGTAVPWSYGEEGVGVSAPPGDGRDGPGSKRVVRQRML
jgi:hypothetical protein